MCSTCRMLTISLIRRIRGQYAQRMVAAKLNERCGRGEMASPKKHTLAILLGISGKTRATVWILNAWYLYLLSVLHTCGAELFRTYPICITPATNFEEHRTVDDGVYLRPLLGRFSRIDCPTTKRVPIPNHASSSQISRRAVFNAELY